MASSSTLDSLDLLEIFVHLERLGFDITDTRFDRLQPYLVLPYPVEWQLGSLMVCAEVIAQQDGCLLATHESSSVLVGTLEPGSQRGRGKRYRSLILACCEFISMVESSTAQ